MQDKPKTVFVLGSFHAGNFGDMAILRVVLQQYLQNFQHIYVSSHTSSSKVSKNEFLEIINISSKDAAKIELVESTKVAELLKTVINADVVSIGGGGLFFSKGFVDTLWPLNGSQILVWFVLGVWAKLWKKQLWVIGVGVDEMGMMARIFVKILAIISDKFLVRDQQSLENTSQKRAKLAVDVVLSKYNPELLNKTQNNSDSKKPTSKSSKEILICLKQSDKLLEKYLLLFREFNFPEVKFKLVSSNPKKDNHANRLLADMFGFEFIDSSKMTLIEFEELFQKPDLVISSRMHPIIFSNMNNIPTIGISPYVGSLSGKNKVINWQKMVGLGSLFVDLEEENLSSKLSNLVSSQLAKNSSEILAVKQKIAKKLTNLKEKALKNF